MNKVDIERMKGFADRGVDLFNSMLWAFHEQELDDKAKEYMRIAMMAIATDCYNQGWAEGDEHGWKECKEVGDVFG
jgi:hypothetical protein